MSNLKEIFKQLTNKLSRTVRYSPIEIERQIILAKIDAVSDYIDRVAIELETRITCLEEKLNQFNMTKKVKKERPVTE